MTQSQTVAIIVPVFNTAQYLPDCVQSILKQTYQDWECFMIDDGSTDNSGTLVDQLAQKDPRLHALHKNNGGLGSARNFVLNILRQKPNDYGFVGFLDSDDILEPSAYEVLTKAINHDKSDLAICGYYKFYENEKKIRGKVLRKEVLNRDDFIASIFSQKRWKDLCGAGGMACTRLYTMNAALSANFIEDKSILEDENFNVQVAEKINTISYVPEPLYGYRVRFNSLVRNSKFPFRMLEGRGLCLSIAKQISTSAYLTTVSAYIHAYLSYLKNSDQVKKIPLAVSNNDIKSSFTKGYMDRKTFVTFNIYQKSPLLFHLFLFFRKIFKSLAFWKLLKNVNK